MDNSVAQKKHRKAKTGKKAEKKKVTAEKRRELHRAVAAVERAALRDEAADEAAAAKAADAGEKRAKEAERNPRAFSCQSTASARKAMQRRAEKVDRKLHAPIVDRAGRAPEPPPVVVAVTGPPGVGKSTLVASLVKHYARRGVAAVRGPITVVAGRRRRITLVEVPNDVNAMVDAAKTADIVLMLIDACFGFEMETFEMVAMLQQHGFPKVMGILTHLDQFDKPKQVKQAKTHIKKRFWDEVFNGAKLFYLSGLLHGRYPKMEILNLARFLSVMKLRPLVWRSSHPYFLADRMEDLTDPERVRRDPTVDRTVSLYGWVHGSNFKSWMKVHVAGVGDFSVREIRKLDDPCPCPKGEKLRRTLTEKQRLIYAPMTDLGDLVYDRDAVYINLPASAARSRAEELGPGEEMLRTLQNASAGIDEKLADSSIPVFAGDVATTSAASSAEPEDAPAPQPERKRRPAFAAKAEEEDDDDKEEEEKEEDDNPDFEEDDEIEEEAEEDEEEEEEEDFAEYERKWKTVAVPVTRNLADLIYRSEKTGDDEEEEEYDEDAMVDEDEDLFYRAGSKKTKREAELNESDSSKPRSQRASEVDLEDETLSARFVPFDSFGDGFVPPRQGATAAAAAGGDGGDEEVFGEWEDLEAGEKGAEAKRDVDEAEKRAQKKEQQKAEFDAEYENKRQRGSKAAGPGAAAAAEEEDAEGEYYERLAKKQAAQQKINEEELAGMDEATRISLAGVTAGSYVRLVLDGVPCEFVHGFDPVMPVVVGGLLTNEDQLGLVQVRLKKHRWHKKILKTRDPLIISLGWRRFQTVVTYSMTDTKGHHRAVKYTPEHLHCMGTFYGPLTPPATGLVAFQTLSSTAIGFRVAALGVVLELDQSFRIVKKLKLTGTPSKIFQNTAFIRNMFTSALEVAKFEGAHLRTVSGIRGQVKKALASPPGCFRASFEDRIKMSDIVFMRTWVPVEPPKLYNPVTNLLRPLDAPSKPEPAAPAPAPAAAAAATTTPAQEGWTAMRTVRDLRADRGMSIPQKADSGYLPPHKPYMDQNKRHLTAGTQFKVPPSLAARLPFSAQHLVEKARRTPLLETRRARAVIPERSELDAMQLVQELTAIRHEKERQTRLAGRAKKKHVDKRKRHEEKVHKQQVRKRKHEVARILYGRAPQQQQGGKPGKRSKPSSDE